jgi:itaconyl-CoA hydratase
MVFANLGWNEIRLSAPVFEGDTIPARSEVLEARTYRLRKDAGIVTVKATGYNQDGTVVIMFKGTIVVYRRGEAPKLARPIPEEELRSF